MSRGLHRRAARLAERNSVSLNTFLNILISHGVGAEDFSEYLAQKIVDQQRATTIDVKIVKAHYQTEVNASFLLLPDSPLYIPESKTEPRSKVSHRKKSSLEVTQDA
jgi:hypothetical protein